MQPLGVHGYQVRLGTLGDRALLVRTMIHALGELGPAPTPAHMAATIDLHLSAATPHWWVALETAKDSPVAGLWLGNAVDQQQEDRHAYVLLLYVDPSHRRRGIATALLNLGEAWARQRSDRQIGLQVYAHNEAAIALYQQRGYLTTSLWLSKSLEQR